MWSARVIRAAISAPHTRSALASVLLRLPRRDRERPRQLAETVCVQRRDGLVADAEAARARAVQRPQAPAAAVLARAQQPAADQHRVLPRGGPGPQQARARRRSRERAQGRDRRRDRADRQPCRTASATPSYSGAAARVQGDERVALAGQRAVSTRPATPARAPTRSPDRRRATPSCGPRTPPCTRSETTLPPPSAIAVVGRGVAKQAAHELLLERPERLLAVQLELAGDRMAEALLRAAHRCRARRRRAPPRAHRRRSTCLRP